MKKTFICLLFGFSLLAQNQRTVVLTWEDTRNPAGTTYSVFRATGLCSGTPTFSKIATAVTQKTYSDTGVTIGNNYCYTVAAALNGVESAQSNQAPVLIQPFEVINLKGEAK